MSRGDEAQGRLGSNSAVLFLSYGFNTVLAGVVAILLIRYLGREQYGLLTTTYAYLTFFQLLTHLGLDTLIIREVAREPERAEEILNDVLGLRLGLALGSMLLSWLFVLAVRPMEPLSTLILIATLSLPFGFSSLFLVSYQVELRMGRPKLIMGVWSALLVLAKLAMIVLEFPLEAFVAAEPVSALVVFLLSRWLGRRDGLHPKPRWEWARWRPLIAQAWPLMVALGCIQIYLRIDQLMLYRMAGAAAVGLYGASVRLVEFGNVIPIVFMGSVFPLLSRMHASDDSRLGQATALSFRAMAWVSVPAAVYLFLFAEPVIGTLLGEEFRDPGPLRVLAWAMPLTFANSVLFNRLFSSGDQRTAAVLALSAGLLNVGLNLVLIPAKGAVGAGLATVVAYGSVLVAAVLASRSRDVGRAAFRGFGRTGLLGAAELGLLVLLPVGPVLAAVLLAVVHPVLLVVSGEVGPEERRVIRRAFGGSA